MFPSVSCMATYVAPEVRGYYSELCYVQIEKDAKLRIMHMNYFKSAWRPRHDKTTDN